LKAEEKFTVLQRKPHQLCL